MTDEILTRLEEVARLGFLEGRLGLPGDALTLESNWGPIEGVREGDTITWRLPDHREYELRLLPDHAWELMLFGRLVARAGPVEIEPDDPD